MCTVSWMADASLLRVWCNRDEKRDREEALPPRVFETEGLAWIAPIDSRGGGTWIAVNEFGLVLALLNRYDVPSFTGSVSRGSLVPPLVRCDSLVSVEEEVTPARFAGCGPVTLLALHFQSARRWDWDGHIVETGLVNSPVTTCGVRSAEIESRRYQIGESLSRSPRTPARHERFHHWREPSDPGAGVLMDRMDAQTVSLTRVVASPHEVSMAYAPRNAESDGFAEPVDVRLAPRCDRVGR